MLSVNTSTNGGISNATAIENSSIDAGSGNDVININANAQANGGGWWWGGGSI